MIKQSSSISSHHSVQFPRSIQPYMRAGSATIPVLPCLSPSSSSSCQQQTWFIVVNVAHSGGTGIKTEDRRRNGAVRGGGNRKRVKNPEGTVRGVTQVRLTFPSDCVLFLARSRPEAAARPPSCGGRARKLSLRKLIGLLITKNLHQVVVMRDKKLACLFFRTQATPKQISTCH